MAAFCLPDEVAPLPKNESYSDGEHVGKNWCFCPACPNYLAKQPHQLYNTLFSQEENFAKSEFDIIFSRIRSRENIFPRKYRPANCVA